MLDAMNASIPFSQATGVLDDGCGTALATGLLLDRFATELPATAKVIATDFSAGLIENVRKHQTAEVAKGNEAWKRVDASVMDAMDLSGIADGSLTHVMAGFVLFMVSDGQKALREALRVLTAAHGGGVLAATSFKQSEWIDCMNEALQAVRPEVPTMHMGPAWGSVEGMTAELEKAGFREARAEEVETFMAVGDHEQLAQFMVRKMPAGQNMSKGLMPAEIDRFVDEYARRIQETASKGEGRLKGIALLAVGRK